MPAKLRRMRVAYLGPAGTFSEDALRGRRRTAPSSSRCPSATIYDAITAVAERRADRALVPFENSIEGSVRATLDALAFDAPAVAIVGEHDQPITQQPDRPPRSSSWSEIEVVISHPQASAQCARFIRAELPRAEVRGRAEHRRGGARGRRVATRPWAALGAASAARDLRLRRPARGGRGRGRQRDPVRLARAGRDASRAGDGPWKTTLSFSELGADHPGALVEALTEFSSREVNLTRIESRPLRRGLGRYMFFVDLEGSRRRRARRRGDRGAARRRPRTCACSAATRVGGRGIPGG